MFDYEMRPVWIDEDSDFKSAFGGFPLLPAASITGPVPRLFEAALRKLVCSFADAQGREGSRRGEAPGEESSRCFDS
jgi:hypothetical protein